MKAWIDIAGGENDPNLKQVRIVRSEDNTMFRVFAPKYAWHCYDFLLLAEWESSELVNQIQKWATELKTPFETYFNDGVLYLYHSFLGHYD